MKRSRQPAYSSNEFLAVKRINRFLNENQVRACFTPDCHAGFAESIRLSIEHGVATRDRVELTLVLEALRSRPARMTPLGILYSEPNATAFRLSKLVAAFLVAI